MGSLIPLYLTCFKAATKYLILVGNFNVILKSAVYFLLFIIFILVFLKLAFHLSEHSKQTVSVFCVFACFAEYGCSWCTRRGQQTNSNVGCHLLPCFRQSLINCWEYQATASHFAPAVLELQMNGFMWVLGFELRSSHLSIKHNLVWFPLFWL